MSHFGIQKTPFFYIWNKLKSDRYIYIFMIMVYHLEVKVYFLYELFIFCIGFECSLCQRVFFIRQARKTIEWACLICFNFAPANLLHLRSCAPCYLHNSFLRCDYFLKNWKKNFVNHIYSLQFSTQEVFLSHCLKTSKLCLLIVFDQGLQHGQGTVTVMTS